MTKTIKLLDAWKRTQGITSDNQAALALGVTRSTVSTWRHGLKQAAPPSAARMARDLGLDELSTLASIEAERAIDGDTKRTWARLAGRALAALLLLAAWGAAPLPAEARNVAERAYGASVETSLDIMRSVARWLEGMLSGWLASAIRWA